MRQIVVISGKGGTGKTSVTAALAAVACENAAPADAAREGEAPPPALVLADCDVDASDLHLLLAPVVRERHDFHSGVLARIDAALCTRCGTCTAACRYGALDAPPHVAREMCEGCGACAHVCPEGAVALDERHCGEWYVSDTRFGPMVHAALGIGEENSGKLVSTVRNRAREIAESLGARAVLIDGSPGVGCPVIASLAGADTALLVTEPTVSALHDLERVHALTLHFGVRAAVLLNKADIHTGMARHIEAFCTDHGLPLLGSLPHSPVFMAAQFAGLSVPEFAPHAEGALFREVWNSLQAMTTTTAET
ncbi:4Fe-4S binding protein [Nitratidesulfovibrio liaohensis]|uniref:4Fe-4S binding protein n=1 Tax=Nitratidesulfovibrio liaohensis TaxID=2604158 RepID=A0ABY9R1G6_9BACT|nr:4Fe-4S binding protein [Nitratidesulfovibrio liaohensis]WMW64848.1 4Fe-4S binding protein [Nitratidesulfovibrio liaohensis]